MFSFALNVRIQRHQYYIKYFIDIALIAWHPYCSVLKTRATGVDPWWTIEWHIGGHHRNDMKGASSFAMVDM